MWWWWYTAQCDIISGTKNGNLTSLRPNPTRMRQVASTGPAGLAFEIPDIFLPTVAAIADEGVDLVIGDAEVPAFRVWTGKSGCRDPFPAATRALDL